MEKLQNKINYQSLMEHEIAWLNGRKAKLMLHSCCAPCSSSVLEKLSEHFDITVLFYNPNIFPYEEYRKRLDEQIRFLNIAGNIPCVEAEYLHDDFLAVSEGFENEAEGGKRCEKCFNLRIRKAVQIANDNGFEYITTTLSVSPHKNAAMLNDILIKTTNEYKIKPLLADFKKKDGYKRSVQLSEQYGIYRQDYCGCEFSK